MRILTLAIACVLCAGCAATAPYVIPTGGIVPGVPAFDEYCAKFPDRLECKK